MARTLRFVPSLHGWDDSFIGPDSLRASGRSRQGARQVEGPGNPGKTIGRFVTHLTNWFPGRIESIDITKSPLYNDDATPVHCYRLPDPPWASFEATNAPNLHKNSHEQTLLPDTVLVFCRLSSY